MITAEEYSLLALAGLKPFDFWGPHDESMAIGEGWVLVHNTKTGLVAIEKLDDDERFESDDDAICFASAKSSTSTTARLALFLAGRRAAEPISDLPPYSILSADVRLRLLQVDRERKQARVPEMYPEPIDAVAYSRYGRMLPCEYWTEDDINWSATEGWELNFDDHHVRILPTHEREVAEVGLIVADIVDDAARGAYVPTLALFLYGHPADSLISCAPPFVLLSDSTKRRFREQPARIRVRVLWTDYTWSVENCELEPGSLGHDFDLVISGLVDNMVSERGQTPVSFQVID